MPILGRSQDVILNISYFSIKFKGKMLDNIFPTSIYASEAPFELI